MPTTLKMKLIILHKNDKFIALSISNVPHHGTAVPTVDILVGHLSLLSNCYFRVSLITTGRTCWSTTLWWTSRRERRSGQPRRWRWRRLAAASTAAVFVATAAAAALSRQPRKSPIGIARCLRQRKSSATRHRSWVWDGCSTTKSPTRLCTYVGWSAPTIRCWRRRSKCVPNLTSNHQWFIMA